MPLSKYHVVKDLMRDATWQMGRIEKQVTGISTGNPDLVFWQDGKHRPQGR